MGVQEWWAARGDNQRRRNAAKLAFREAMVRNWKSWGQEVAAEDKVLEKMPERMKETFWRMTPEQRQAFLSYEALERKGVKRRTVLGAAAALSAAAFFSFEELLALDQLSGKNKEQESKYARTHLEIFEDCKEWFHPEEGDKPGELFFATAGIGILDSFDAAKEMARRGLGVPDKKTTPMTYLVTSVEGKKLSEVADVILEASNMGEGLSFYGQSNGGVVILEALHVLKQRKENGETNGKIVPVKRLILNCSPFDFDDAQQNFLEKLFGRLLVFSGYTPGDVSQFFYQLKEEADIDWGHVYENLLQKIETAWDKAQGGNPTAPWVADLRILIQSRLKDYDLSGIITEDTEVLFLESEHDGIVRNGSSSSKYREKFKKYGVKDENFTVIPLPNNAGHADVVAAGDAAKPWLNRQNLALAA